MQSGEEEGGDEDEGELVYEEFVEVLTLTLTLAVAVAVARSRSL